MRREKLEPDDESSRRVVLALIHSPLVGPSTWEPLAGELQRRGVEVVVPEIGAPEEGIPCWRSHAGAIARALLEVPVARRLVLVAHSGAGLLLPAVRDFIGRPVAGYIFADAGIPENGKSRLDLWGSKEEAEEFRRYLASGGLFPNWSDEDLRAVIPDVGLRRRVLAELRPQALTYWDEAIPVFDGWPDAPCGYLLFSATYYEPAEVARRRGWAYSELAAHHFHMLVDPGAVTDMLLDLLREMGLDS